MTFAQLHVINFKKNNWNHSSNSRCCCTRALRPVNRPNLSSRTLFVLTNLGQIQSISIQFLSDVGCSAEAVRTDGSSTEGVVFLGFFLFRAAFTSLWRAFLSGNLESLKCFLECRCSAWGLGEIVYDNYTCKLEDENIFHTVKNGGVGGDECQGWVVTEG